MSSFISIMETMLTGLGAVVVVLAGILFSLAMIYCIKGLWKELRK